MQKRCTKNAKRCKSTCQNIRHMSMVLCVWSFHCQPLGSARRWSAPSHRCVPWLRQTVWVAAAPPDQPPCSAMNSKLRRIPPTEIFRDQSRASALDLIHFIVILRGAIVTDRANMPPVKATWPEPTASLWRANLSSSHSCGNEGSIPFLRYGWLNLADKCWTKCDHIFVSFTNIVTQHLILLSVLLQLCSVCL